MARRFEAKRVLVTGAASGIGRATSLRLAAEGGSVVALDIDAAGLSETVRLAEQAGGRAIARVCDLSDADAIGQSVAFAADTLGGLDVLCNVAGVLYVEHSHACSLSDWERILRINLTGTFLMCQAALPHLLEARGVIVNTSSTAALGSHPWMAAYAASKGGVLALTRCLSIEYIEQGLRVNCLIPGGVITPIHGQFRVPKGANFELMRGAVPRVPMADPKVAAAAIAYLASDESSFMHGTALQLDGGALG
jgi:NAD(P)-dependent dehydrogenase (short-subunit alcohol dehydrogenase family)